jgi:hypothetical protein
MHRTSISKRPRSKYWAIAFALPAAIAIGLTTAGASPSHGHARTVVVLSADTTTVLDQDTGLTLGPADDASPTSTPGLTADQAWATYASAAAGKSEPTVPNGVDVEVGSLSIPSSDLGPQDDWKYLVRNELVYAYSLTSPCYSTLPTAVATSICTEWTFIDAATGEHIETNFQPQTN